MSGPYRAVLADPPWRYDDKLKMEGRRSDEDGRSQPIRGAEAYYDTMSVAEIRGLSKHIAVLDKDVHLIAGHQVADEALLFLWVTNGMLLDLSGVAVCEAWGFIPKQLATWVKVKVGGWAEYVEGTLEHDEANLDDVLSMNESMSLGMGRIFRNVTEHVIIGTKGKYSSLVKSHGERNAFFAPRAEHSRKPDCVQEAIERLIEGPYLEMFACRRRAGWDAWGFEAPLENKDEE